MSYMTFYQKLFTIQFVLLKRKRGHRFDFNFYIYNTICAIKTMRINLFKGEKN